MRLADRKLAELNLEHPEDGAVVASLDDARKARHALDAELDLLVSVRSCTQHLAFPRLPEAEHPSTPQGVERDAQDLGYVGRSPSLAQEHSCPLDLRLAEGVAASQSRPDVEGGHEPRPVLSVVEPVLVVPQARGHPVKVMVRLERLAPIVGEPRDERERRRRWCRTDWTSIGPTLYGSLMLSVWLQSKREITQMT